jgi:hypothetical protein
MPKRASEWLAYTKEISLHLTANNKEKQPIIIFEDLDKIPVPQKIFEILSYSVLSQMPFPVIYTFPIDQHYSTEFASISAKYKPHTLPMLKVKNKNDTPNTDGITVIKNIVGRRADLELFDKGVLEKLVEKTGGSLRHLFECITTATRVANRNDLNTIRHKDADIALSELRKDFSRWITSKDLPILSKIMKSKVIIDDIEFLLKMMQASIVIEYENGDRWNDVHPLVADFVNEHHKEETND